MGATESFPLEDGRSEETGVALTTYPRPNSSGLPARQSGATTTDGMNPNHKKPTRPLTRISCAVAGGSKVGKRTLLQRLLGKDPNDVNVDKESIPNEITMPYVPPPGMPTWNRILLQVGCVRDEQQVPKADFLVILVRPDTPEEDLVDTTRQIIRQYMHHLGITAKRVGTTEVSSINICILVNFRDLVQGKVAESKVDGLQKSLENFMMGVLKPYSIPEDRQLLQVMSVSVLGGYGLDRLHRFIYRAYLQKKRDALEAQLGAVKNQIKETNEPMNVLFHSNVNVNVDSDAKVRPTNNVDRPPKTLRKENIEETTTDQKPVGKEQNAARVEQQSPTVPKTERMDSTERVDESKTKLLPPVVKQESSPPTKDSRRQIHSTTIQNSRIGKDALEAFLASDSSDDDTNNNKKNGSRQTKMIAKKKSKKQTKTKRIVVESSSDDEDDSDFFYDESGQFKNTNTREGESSSNSESDSSTSQRSTSNAVNTRNRPPSAQDDNQANMEVSDSIQSDNSAVADTSPKRVEGSVSSSQERNGKLDDDEASDGSVTQELEDGEVVTQQTPERPNRSRDSSADNASVTSSLDDVGRTEEAVDDETNHVGIDNEPTDPGSSDIESSAQPVTPLDNDESDVPTKNFEEKVESSHHEHQERTSSASDTIDGQASQKADQDDERSDNSLVVVSEDVEPKATLSAPPAVDDDDSDDEDDFFVDQPQPEIASSSSGQGAGRVVLASSYVDEDENDENDDDEFFVSGGSDGPATSPEDTSNAVANPVTEEIDARTEEEEPSSKTIEVPADGDDQSDDDDGYVIEGSQTVNEELPLSTTSSTPSPPVGVDDSSSSAPQKERRSVPANVDQAETSSTPSNTTGGGSSISAAALLAIQAAQRHAEEMLLQPQESLSSPDGVVSMKKPKKAKKEKKMEKDGKKKKKKKKDKSQAAGEDADVSE